MNVFKPLNDGFSALQLRERIISVVAVAIVLALGGNLAVLKPQLLEINKLRAKETAHEVELAELRRLLVEIKNEMDKGVDPFAKELATLAELNGQIAETNVFLEQADSTTSQVGVLVRGLIKATPGLTLVSLKTRAGTVFYTPPQPPAPPKPVAGGAAGGAIADMLSKLKKEEVKINAPAVVLVKKPLYKHGVEVNVKGAYPALLSYMQEMQNFPRRIFWSEATLDAKNHREATLRLLIYTLSDQETPPLN